MDEEKKSNKGLIFFLVIVMALIFGVVGYSVGIKESKAKPDEEKEEVQEVIDKIESYEEVTNFFRGEIDNDLKYLTPEEAKKAVPSYKQEDGGECSIVNKYLRYGDYYVFIKSESCRYSNEIYIFDKDGEVLSIKDVYSRITIDNKVTFVVPFVRNGKLFLVVNKHKESNQKTFEYIDLKHGAKEVEVNDLEATS